MQIPYAETDRFLSVEVTLKSASDVYLVDSTNFRRHEAGQSFDYFGGYYTSTPVNITVEGKGKWYLIVKGSGTYNYRFY